MPINLDKGIRYVLTLQRGEQRLRKSDDNVNPILGVGFLRVETAGQGISPPAAPLPQAAQRRGHACKWGSKP
jgi:hypothetical protein